MIRRRAISFLLTFLLVLAMLPVNGLSVRADDTNAAASMFDQIINQGEPSGFSADGVDPYGYGTGVPFTLSAANELVVYGSSESSSTDFFSFNSYDNLQYYDLEGADFLSAGKINKTYNYWESNVATKKALNAPQLVSFDPKGIGRKDHLAVLGVNFTGSSASLCLCVYDNNGQGTQLGQLEIGSVNWMRNAGEYFTYYSVKNYYSITAGDYDGDHKDTLVVYGCLDGWGLGLFEIKAQENNGGLSLEKVNQSAMRNLLMPVYDGSGDNSEIQQVNTFVTSTGSSNTYRKLCGEVATGDMNGDHVDDLAVLTYHAGKFLGCYPYLEADGNNNPIVVEERTWDPSSPYVSYQLGEKGSSTSVISRKTGGSWVHQYTGDSKYDFDSVAAPSLAVGEITGDQKSEIIVGGYLKKIKSGASGKQKVDNEDTTVLVSYKASEACLTDGPSNWNMTTAELMKNGFYESDHDIFNKSTVVTAAIDGRGMPGYVFVNGMLARVSSQSFETVIYGNGLEQDPFSSSDYYSSRASNAYTNVWIDSVAVGNFDGGIDGKEEIIYSIGVKTKSADKFCFDMGEIYLTGEGNISSRVQMLQHPAANTPGNLTAEGKELCLALCSVDNDYDGMIAKYVGKTWFYSDPEIVALLQAAPYFKVMKDANALYTPGTTSYSVTESYSLERTSSNSVSFGVGGTHALGGTIGGYEVKAGYALDWSEEFTKTQTTSTTITQTAGENSVVISRTPVIIYYYHYMNEEGEYPAKDNIYEIAIPQEPVTERMSVESYNEFAQYYNEYFKALAKEKKIDETNAPSLPIVNDPHLLTEGDPSSYWSTTDNGYILLTNSPQRSGPGNSSVTVEHSTESSSTTTESKSHGFNFELTLTFGLNIPEFVTSTVGGYTSLNYMQGSAKATTKMSGKGIAGTVSNYDSELAKAAGITNYNNCGFDFQMAKWNFDRTYPVYGYVLSKIDAPIMKIEGTEITLDKTEYLYTGQQIRPEPLVKLGDKTLQKDTDYTISYANNVEKGTAKVTVTGIGSWSGSVEKTFAIVSRFAGNSLSLDGDIGVNFYLRLTSEEAASAKASFAWNSKKLENVAVVPDPNGTGLYRTSCPVAVAEMTDGVTVTLSLNGKVLPETATFSVVDYADVILTDNGFITSYVGANGANKYNRLAALVKNMLDVGGNAQIHFNHNVDNLAGKKLVTNDQTSDYYMDRYEVTGETISSCLENTLHLSGEISVPEEYREKYGLAYVGSTLVFLSKTSLRHYFKVVDEEKFALVKDYGIGWNGGSANSESVQPVEKDGLVYFEKRNIGAKELQSAQNLSVGGIGFTYSPLHYLMACINSNKISDSMKELARAAFRYARAADAYFG